MAKDKAIHVLIIEDEPGFRLIYRGVLENAGFDVSEARDGKTGADMAVKLKPDIILLDLVLPELNGYEVLKKIRADKNTKNTPVIIFSVLGTEKDIQKGFELGANDYRIKGANSPIMIVDKIRSLLNKDELDMDAVEP